MKCPVDGNKCNLRICHTHSCREQAEIDFVHSCSYRCERPECVRAQRDELQADALRYRWLRENCQYGFNEADQGPQLVHLNGETGPHQNAMWREALDAAIDEAMK